MRFRLPPIPLLSMLAVSVLGGCTVGAATGVGFPPPVVITPGPEPVRGSGAIPPGHYPPPGECRWWFPNRPPGQQPPPGPCGKLRHQAPPGAFLVRG